MKSMDKKCAMDESLVMVLVTLELAAANVVNPSQEAREVAFRHLSIVSLVSVPGLAVSETVTKPCSSSSFLCFM